MARRYHSEAGRGILDKIGGILGTPFRALEDDETLGAMDELSTVGASAALKNSANVKGAASDKDMALIRLAGLGPYKTQGENTRIVKDAMYQSGLEQLRAKLTAQWIARNGSLSNPNAKGQTFESYLTLGEGMYADRMSGRTKPRTKSLPKPPPSAKGRNPSPSTSKETSSNERDTRQTPGRLLCERPH
ncbi:hypothetical protein ACFSHP_12080 [Novosphingobium panipatense]